MAIGQDLGTSIKTLVGLGGGAKALLCVVKYNKTGMRTDEIGKNAEEVQSKLMESTRSALGSASANAGAVGAEAAKTIIDADPMSIFRVFEVQYNPNSIRLESLGGRVNTMQNEDSTVDRRLNVYTYDARSTLGFELVFDDMDQMNCFMLDNPLNVSSLGKKAVKEVVNAVKGKKIYSVRSQMDALVGMLARPQTQQVVFFWSNMSFHGIVTRVDAQYTMFSKKGNPVRGTVRLQIDRDMEFAKQYGYVKKDLDPYWENAFQKGFQKPSTASKLAGSVGNLLNFN